MTAETSSEIRIEIGVELLGQLSIHAGDELQLEVSDGEARLHPVLGCDSGSIAANGAAGVGAAREVVNVSTDGSIVLSSDIVKLLCIEPSEHVFSVVEDDYLAIYSLTHLSRYVQDFAGRHPLPDGLLASEELIEDREAEARLESRG